MDALRAVLLALPTIFLGAFLAALVDSTRERIRTRRWVMRNLRTVVERARRDPPPPTAAALRAWLSATTADDLDETAWRQAWYRTVSHVPDLTPLRSQAATSVPVEVFSALGELEQEVETLKRLEPYVNDAFTRDVEPLWYERRVPLTGSDRRRVEMFLLLFDHYHRTVGAVFEAVERLKAAMAARDRRGSRLRPRRAHRPADLR
ncbi:MAG: hypothetical protein FWJ70_07930 [Micromonosporaceae bacterium]|jgi:hypothetical protein